MKNGDRTTKLVVILVVQGLQMGQLLHTPENLWLTHVFFISLPLAILLSVFFFQKTRSETAKPFCFYQTWSQEGEFKFFFTRIMNLLKDYESFNLHLIIRVLTLEVLIKFLS